MLQRTARSGEPAVSGFSAPASRSTPPSPRWSSPTDGTSSTSRPTSARRRHDKHLLGPGRPGAALGVLLSAIVVALTALPVTPAESAPARVTIHVDDDAPSGGNGSGRSPYRKLEDALAAAKA